MKKLQVSVYDGLHVGTAWCDIPEEHENLPLDELVERYVKPSVMAAIARLEESVAAIS